MYKSLLSISRTFNVHQKVLLLTFNYNNKTHATHIPIQNNQISVAFSQVTVNFSKKLCSPIFISKTPLNHCKKSHLDQTAIKDFHNFRVLIFLIFKFSENSNFHYAIAERRSARPTSVRDQENRSKNGGVMAKMA